MFWLDLSQPLSVCCFIFIFCCCCFYFLLLFLLLLLFVFVFVVVIVLGGGSIKDSKVGTSNALGWFTHANTSSNHRVPTSRISDVAGICIIITDSTHSSERERESYPT